MMNNHKKKNLLGLGLISGGLDSLIATLVLKLQNIDVIGLNFKSPFCICDKAYRNSECGLDLFYKKLDLKIYINQKGDDYLEIVKHPKYGYGKNLNPCIDCRIYILKKAKEFAKTIHADFLYTGEVLNQRPKSQNMKALQIIEKESGLEGKLLRPLSARLLKPTIMEQKGLIDRNKLLNIMGRSRKIQLELAREHGLLQNYYACGGCLLTDQKFAIRMKDFLDHNQELCVKNVEILKYGRHFRYKEAKIIVGRDEMENNILLKLKNPGDIIMEPKDIVGPTTIIQGKINDEVIEFAAKLTLRYSDFQGLESQIQFGENQSTLNEIIMVKMEDDEVLKTYIL